MAKYFSLEQLERRILAARAEMRQIRRKTLSISIIASAFVVYSWRFIFDSKMFTTLFVIPLSLNGITWILFITSSFQKLIRKLSQLELDASFDEEKVIDEYRAYQFFLGKLYRYEAIFDTLIGLQFLFLIVCFLATYFLRW